jgi:phospholipid/cholesterol/gamma-HCH transport system substrate-binding protein
VFLTYPFVDEVVGRDPQVARNLHMGDYTNLAINLDLELADLNPVGVPNIPCIELEQIPDVGPLPPVSQLCEGVIDAINECLADPSVANCQGLPDFLVDEVCDQLPIPILCPGVVQQGGGGGQLPDVDLDDLIDGLEDGLGAVGLGGLLRSGTSYQSGGDAGRGPTMGQLSQAFDPGLVALLVPGMVVASDEQGAVK